MKPYYKRLQEIEQSIKDIPTAVYAYYVYKSGKVETFSDEGLAAKRAKDINGNLEEAVINEEEILQYKNNYRSNVGNIQREFLKELRESYSEFNDATYDLIFNLAYEKGHSCGYDEVAGYVSDFANFASSIIKANK